MFHALRVESALADTSDLPSAVAHSEETDHPTLCPAKPTNLHTPPPPTRFKGQEQRGCCVGALGARWRGIIPGKSSIVFPEFTKVLVAFAKKHGPPGFKFTSIQINKNYASGLHVDKNNMGDSQIVGLGDYTEGGLWVHDQGALDVKKKFVAFDGNVPHATLDFEGERFSLIYFVQAQFRQMRDEHKEYLINNLGFPFPDDDVVGRTYETAETRLAAAKTAFGVFNAARQAAMPPSGSTRSSAKATPQVKRAAAAALPRLKARPRPTYAKGSARPKTRDRPPYK